MRVEIGIVTSPGAGVQTVVHQSRCTWSLSKRRVQLSARVHRSPWGTCASAPDEPPHSSRLLLPERYVVPGGRFDEIYYRNSYFTMLGLEESGRHDLTLAMLANLLSLIECYCHLPNGNRSYCLSRFRGICAHEPCHAAAFPVRT